MRLRWHAARTLAVTLSLDLPLTHHPQRARTTQAIGAGVGGKEAKQPETDFVRDDPQWLAEAAAMTDDFMATPVVEHLAQGRLGAPLSDPSLDVTLDC